MGVIIVAFLLLLAVPFLFQLSTERKMIENSYKNFTAMSLAKPGAERAIWELDYGTICVPRAQVEINQEISYSSALACNSIWLSQKGNLHYDEQLKDWVLVADILFFPTGFKPGISYNWKLPLSQNAGACSCIALS